MVAEASGAIRRASGRVRKAPEAYTSSPYASSNKRKRSNHEEGDVQMPDDYVSDEDVPSEDDEPDEEEVREQNRKSRAAKPAAPKRQPAPKKAKTNGQSKPLAIRPAAAGKKKKAPKRVNATNAAEAEVAGGLYAAVFARDDALDAIAASWLQRFDDHESQALAEVVNFVLRSAGCESEVTAYDIEDPDGASNRLTDIQDEYQATNPTEYPLIAKGNAGKKFKDSMSSFLSILIKSLGAKGVLIENKLVVDNIEVWLSTMSSAANRAFRHTATIASLAVMTALCELAAEHANEASAAQRQSEGERKKNNTNKARVKRLEQKVADSNEAQRFFEELLVDWFDAVFVHRYRDVDPVLRRECATALGDWIAALPSMFFDGAHLRYLGWVLSDEVAATRAEVVNQLKRLYKEQDKIAGLKTFTEKFRPRMVEIATSDAESTVRASGIELLDLLRKNGLLEPDDVDSVGRLIYDSDPRVRRAVAQFFAETVIDVFNAKVDDLGGLDSLQESLPDTSEGSFDTPCLEWLKFKSLAEMMVAYDMEEALPHQIVRNRGDGKLTLNATALESRFTLTADSLYDSIIEMKDWQGLAGYLLFDHSSSRANGVARDMISQLKHECVLEDKEEFVLLEVVGSSVKHFLNNIAEKTNKVKLTKKQKEELKDEQEETARYLASLIPRLLKKFGGVPSTAAAVLRMESVLNLPSLEDLHQDSVTYGALLDGIRKQFMSHGADEVLVPASNAIQHAKSYVELDDLTEEKLAGLWEDVVNNLAELLNQDITVRGASDEDELVALSNNLLRITRLSLISNPISSLEDNRIASKNDATGADYNGAIDFVIALIQRALPSSGPAVEPELAALEDDVAARAAEAGLRYLQWKVNQIIETVQSGTVKEIPFDDLEALATRRDTFIDNLHSVLDSRKAGDAVSATFARNTLQLHSTTAVLRNLKAKPGMRDDWEVLVMDLPAAYLKFVLKVFAAAEKNFAKLTNKRLERNVAKEEDDDIDADPMDEDPVSESESEGDDDDEEQQHLRSMKKQRKALLAEQTLCELTGALIVAIHAEVVEHDTTRKRLERNKNRLGPNFKETCAYLDLGNAKKSARSKSKAKSKPAINGAASKSKPTPKSNAIVAEDEEDDEIEDVDGEDEEALRRGGLVVDEERDDEEDGNEAGAERDAESVLGD